MKRLRKSSREYSNTLAAYACESCFHCNCARQCGTDLNLAAFQSIMNARFSMMLAAMQEWSP